MDTQNMLRQIASIVEIIDRDHMKVSMGNNLSNFGGSCTSCILALAYFLYDYSNFNSIIP